MNKGMTMKKIMTIMVPLVLLPAAAAAGGLFGQGRLSSTSAKVISDAMARDVDYRWGLGIRIAASDASAADKAVADYQCDGTADEVQIQAAIDALVGIGGEVRLSAGTFIIADTIMLRGTTSTGTGIALRGSGMSVTKIQAASTLAVNMIEASPLEEEYFIEVTDLTIYGNKANQTTGHGIYATDNDGGSPSDMQIRNLFVLNCAEDGMNFEYSWGYRVVNCIAELNGGNGIYFGSGSQNYIAYCFVAYNAALRGDAGLFLNGNTITSIVGNSIYANAGAKSGMYIRSVYDCTIVGNNLRNNDLRGLQVRTSSDNTIVGNTFDDTGGVQDYGIWIRPDSPNNLVTGNSFNGQVIANVLDEGGNSLSSCYDNISSKPMQEYKWKPYKNTSGGTVTAGDVVIMGATGEAYTGTQFITTTTAGDSFVLGMAGETIADDATGNVLVFGATTKLKADGTDDIAIGDLLGTFTSAGISAKAASGDVAFAIALEAYTADDSLGVIDALIISPRPVK